MLSYLSDLTFVSDHEGIDNPFIALVVRFLFVCVGTRDLHVVSYWIATLVLKNRGKYLRYFAASPFPLQGKTNACSRGSKNDFWRRCRGDLRQVKTYQVPITTITLRITLFAICLSFSSPPLHPCRFIFPLSSSSFSFPICLFLPVSCLLVCWIDCLLRWLKIILNCVTLPIPSIMILLALRLLLLPMLNLVKLMLLC